MAQPPVIYKPGKLNSVWNWLGRTLSDFTRALIPYIKTSDQTINVSSAEEMKNLCVTGGLVPGATYRVPYKAVNFLNGRNQTALTTTTQTVTPGDADGQFLTNFWNQGFPYNNNIYSMVLSAYSDYMYAASWSSTTFVYKLSKTGEVVSTYNVGFRSETDSSSPFMTVGVVQPDEKLLVFHKDGSVPPDLYFTNTTNQYYNTIYMPGSYSDNPGKKYLKTSALARLNTNGTLDEAFTKNNPVGVPNDYIRGVTTFGPNNDKILVYGDFVRIGGITADTSTGGGILDFTYNKTDGNDGIYLLAPNSTTGGGSLEQFEIVVVNNKVDTIQTSIIGAGHAVGDVLTIDPGVIGNTDAIEITVTEIRDIYYCDRLVALNSDGSIYQEFMDNYNLDPFCCQLITVYVDDAGNLILGGDSGGFAKYSPTGVLNTTFDTNKGTAFNSRVYSIVQVREQSSAFYGNYIAGGAFTSYDGNTAEYIAMINTDGTFNNTWLSGTGSQFDSQVTTITDNYCVWGQFTDFDGTACNSVIKLDIDNITSPVTIDYRLDASKLRGIVGEVGNTEHVFMFGQSNLMSGNNQVGQTYTDNYHVPNVADYMRISKVFISAITDPYWDQNAVHVSDLTEYFHVKAVTNYTTELAVHSEQFPSHKINYIPWATNLCLGNLANYIDLNQEFVYKFDGKNPYIEITDPNYRIIFGASLEIGIDGWYADDTELDIRIQSVKPGPFYPDSPYDFEIPDRYPLMQVSPDGKRITFLNWGYGEYVKTRSIFIGLPIPVADMYGKVTSRTDTVANITAPADWVGIRYRRYYTSGDDLTNMFTPGGASIPNFFVGTPAEYFYGTNDVYVPTTYFVDVPIFLWNMKEEPFNTIVTGDDYKNGFYPSGTYGFCSFDNVVFMEEAVDNLIHCRRMAAGSFIDPDNIYSTTAIHLANFVLYADSCTLPRYAERVYLWSCSQLIFNNGTGINVFKQAGTFFSNCEFTTSINSVIIDNNSAFYTASPTISYTSKTVYYEPTLGIYTIGYYDSGAINYVNL